MTIPLAIEALLVALAYGLRARSLARRGRGVPAWRQAAFYLGLALLLVAVAPPLDAAGEEVFHLHMVQHLLIVDGAALLVLLGLSGPLLRPLLALPGALRLRRLASPLVALPVWALVLYAWHLPVLYQAALRSEALHALEHASFFAAGLLIWAAVLEPLPGPRWFGAGGKAAYVLAVRMLTAVLGSIFIWAGQPLYPAYAEGARERGISPLTDQAIGGGIMFVEGAVVTLVLFSWIFLRWAAPGAPPRSPPSP